ncbi:DNA topoisomerase [Photobacterium frigidiphilum]|uniref:DNA topoisomerase n=1 Tax=Photobacterium frigidiphilum TaxID=264736 RepID=A0A2T3JEC5_9GAMM|nr:topoisomerase DNA-binding C4 zinc finger domain-containing protein [Photobacterium frigidiphilum]PSU47258.1 DNA topoisomerase [Photobacterium frigidiphilum]
MAGKVHDQLFDAHGHALEQEEPCPTCGGQLQTRYGKRGPFLGCSNYPECDFIRPQNQNDGHIVKHLGKPCPSCDSELVLRQGRFGMFIGCASFPDCQHIEPLEKKADDTQILCPDCHKGHLVQRKSRYGKVFFACDQYPACRFAVNNKPVAQQCETCGFPLLVEKDFATGIKLQCADKKCHHIQQ